MHKPESVQENVMHEAFWDLKIKMDHQIQNTSPGVEKKKLITRRKKTCYLVAFFPGILR